MLVGCASKSSATRVSQLANNVHTKQSVLAQDRPSQPKQRDQSQRKPPLLHLDKARTLNYLGRHSGWTGQGQATGLAWACLGLLVLPWACLRLHLSGAALCPRRFFVVRAMTAGLVLVDVLLRRHAGIAHDALWLAFFFSCRFADQRRLTLIVTVDELWFPGGFCVSKEIIQI